VKLTTTSHVLAGLLLLGAGCGDTVPAPRDGGVHDRSPALEGGPRLDWPARPPGDSQPDLARPDLLRPDQKRPPATSTQAVSFSHKTQPFQGIAYDTGWQPSGSPVQVRFSVAVSAQVEATLPGTATLTRDTALALTYAGSPSAGKLSMDIGFQMGALLKIDTSVVKWEGKLPLIPKFDFRFIDAESFTPFVLQGSTPRPVHLEDTKPKQLLFTVPIPGLSISVVVGYLGGVVDVNAGGTLTADLTGQKISTTLLNGPTLTHTTEGQSVTTPDRGKNPEAVSSAYAADLHYDGTITLYPTITITTPIPGVKWAVAEFPIAIPLSTFGKLDETWSFAPQSMTFDLK
jgi:hypothetical protein